MFFFFFSSRRRHTRYWRDWSSDVCSSDLRREIGTENFARNLELQAQVDTYLVLLMFVAFFRKTQKISRADRRWLRFHMFSRVTPNAYADPNLRGRYLETTELSANYTAYLD